MKKNKFINILLNKVFNQMPNPGNHMIEELSEELGLDAAQAQKDMVDHEIIHLENNRLHSENLQMYYELTKQFCATCNNYEQQQKVLQDLQNENTKLREEVTLISNMVNHLKEDPEKYLLLLKQNHLHHYNDSNGLDLELRLGYYDDPNGLDLEL
ncbi:hypothetical protein RND71_022280 [Anisodus tanguticus]|uniref:Uncharacterized protein n=1 Tax=Anisodus tanguticus TaxID=243964 RepID=A0AAE1S046_9SOLA|nr:hypothetical protein RND71_022280 [Anisodus tanguticus]